MHVYRFSEYVGKTPNHPMARSQGQAVVVCVGIKWLKTVVLEEATSAACMPSSQERTMQSVQLGRMTRTG